MPDPPPQTGPPPHRFRAILPPSLAGRLWAAAALLVVPALLLAVIEVPIQLLADRLPDTSGWILAGRPIAESPQYVYFWGLLTAILWVGLLTSHLTVPEVRPSRRWTSFLPVMYYLIGGAAGLRAGLVVENLDAEQFSYTRGMVPALAQTGVFLAFCAVGELLARRVARHLPSEAPSRLRTTWVGSVPVGPPSAVAHTVFPLLQFVLITGGGNASLGLMLAGILFVSSQWLLWSSEVVVTPAEIRVIQGARSTFRLTKTVPLAEITHVDVVDVSSARVVAAGLLFRGAGRFTYRRGPALRVSHHPTDWPATWLIGMENQAEAEHAAATIRNWRQASTATLPPGPPRWVDWTPAEPDARR